MVEADVGALPPVARRAPLLVTFLLSLVLGVGLPLTPPGAQRADAVIGGEGTTDPAVVPVLTTYRDGTGTCTGGFVTATQVAAAAHCVHDRPAGADPKAPPDVPVAPGAVSLVVQGQHVPVTAVDVSPDYLRDREQIELGDVVLLTVDPATLPPVRPRLVPRPVRDDAGGPAVHPTYYGWGAVNGGGVLAAGVRRVACRDVSDDRDLLAQFGEEPRPDLHRALCLPRATPWDGDSGGPALDVGLRRSVLGVLSTVLPGGPGILVTSVRLDRGAGRDLLVSKGRGVTWLGRDGMTSAAPRSTVPGPAVPAVDPVCCPVPSGAPAAS